MQVISGGAFGLMADAIAGSFGTPKIALIKSDFAISWPMTAGDLEFATDAGLAIAAPGAWSLLWEIVPGVLATALPSKVFIATALAAPIIIYGWALMDAAGTSLLAVHHLDTPVPIETIGDGLIVQVILRSDEL